MNPSDFGMLADLLKQRSGLSLSSDKTYLLQSRLTPVARKMGYNDIDALISEIRSNKSEPMLENVTEAMTTNETFFFRDSKPFHIFRNFVLPTLQESRPSKSLKIWCAACSTGQEPYTIAMILKDMEKQLTGWRFDIKATDISSSVLEKAKVGIYSQFEVQRGLPIQFLVNHFKQTNETWQIDASIRAMVKFQKYNLLDNLSRMEQNDVVFCRNVLIYFDKDTKRDVLERMARQMPDDGFLFLGAAETVMGITDVFVPVPGQRGVYSKAK